MIFPLAETLALIGPEPSSGDDIHFLRHAVRSDPDKAFLMEEQE